MKLGAIDFLLLGLAAFVLSLIVLRLRAEFLDWRATRHHREEKRRYKRRGRHWSDCPPFGPVRLGLMSTNS